MLRRSLFLRSIILCLEGRTSTSQVFYRSVKNVCSLLSTFCSFFLLLYGRCPIFCSMFITSARCSLIVTFLSLIVVFCSLLVTLCSFFARYFLLVARYILLLFLPFCSLHVTRFFARCFLLFSLHIFFALVFTYFAYLTIQRKIDGHVLNCLL